ncbi:MAG: hypothetical protein ACHQ2Z_02530, partial [Elusimicrobiota bacterium]
MDSFQLWKDDYRREVEEVLAERRRAREKGDRPDAAPSEGFSGRWADLVIPPAGVHAEAAALRSRLEQSEAENASLAARVKTAEDSFARERDRRERIKDAASRLALDLRGAQAELFVAREQARLAEERLADAERGARNRGAAEEARLREARLDSDHAAARAEDAERASSARLQSARELYARYDSVLLETEAKAAEISALKTRLDAAHARAAAAEAREADFSAVRSDLEAARAAIGAHAEEGRDLESRVKESWEAARSAGAQADRARSELRAETVRCEALEAALQKETLRALAAERNADGAIAAAAARVDEMLAAERAKLHEEAAAARADADRLRAEGEGALEQARRLEAEIPARLA